MRLPKVPPQIVRLLLLTLAIVGSYLVARAFLTPPSFGDYGWYRGNALGEIASRTPVYAGKKACDECHSEILQKLARDSHKNLSCEACHGVSRVHADDPDVPPGSTSTDQKGTKPEKLNDRLCLRCHEANPSRPAGFKQIVVKSHYSGKCTECHMPHQPTQSP